MPNCGPTKQIGVDLEADVEKAELGFLRPDEQLSLGRSEVFEVLVDAEVVLEDEIVQ